jgi:lactoylglutathione lyase
MNVPILNLITIRCMDPERSVKFYELLGLTFIKEKHGEKGVEHYSAKIPEGTIFEIYPETELSAPTTGVLLGFKIDDLEELSKILEDNDVSILSPMKDTPWGKRLIVADPDHHTLQLFQNES